MTFAAHIGAFFLAPFMAISAFFGLGNHATTTPYMASTSPWTASSTTHTATSTGIHLPGSNGGVRLPPGVNPGGPMIPYAGTTTPVLRPVVLIKSESVASGPVGTVVTLNGGGFTSKSIVHFASGAVQNTTVSDNGTKLAFTIPSSLGAYCKPDQACPMYEMLVTNGTYKLYVENVPETGDATGPISNTVDFTVTGGGASLGL